MNVLNSYKLQMNFKFGIAHLFSSHATHKKSFVLLLGGYFHYILNTLKVNNGTVSYFVFEMPVCQPEY